jgi:hypothetical protein
MKDIVAKGAWTTVPKNSKLRAETPTVRVTPYALRATQITQAINGFTNIAKKKTKDFYNGLYSIDDVKETYSFPYFDNDFRNFSNEFSDTLSQVTDRGTTSIGDMAKGLGDELVGGVAKIKEIFGGISDAVGRDKGDVSTGTYIESPKFYQFDNNDEPIKFSFPLLNTIDSQSVSDNMTFIKEFTKLNRPERKDSITMTFPHIYRVNVKGLRYIRWAFCNNLSFSMVGQRRMVGGSIVPEAYFCSMSFKSLTVEVSNFLDEAFQTNASGAEYDTSGNFITGAKEFGGNVLDRGSDTIGAIGRFFR